MGENCKVAQYRIINEPINKIDLAGTTPQNTGLPPRYENEPQIVKWVESNRTAFCYPPEPKSGSMLIIHQEN